MRVKGVSVLSWSWLYGSLIYNYQCNQCLPPQVDGYLRLLWFPPRIKLTATIYLVTEILLKYCSKYKYNSLFWAQCNVLLWVQCNLLLWTRCNSLLSTHYNLLLWIYHTYSSLQYKMNSCEFESRSWGCVLVYGVLWFSPGTPVTSTNKTDR